MFYYYSYSVLTVYFSKIYNFKDSSIFIILNFLQLVTWFPKTVLEGGAWKIFKVKGGLNQKSLGTPVLYSNIIFSCVLIKFWSIEILHLTKHWCRRNYDIWSRIVAVIYFYRNLYMTEYHGILAIRLTEFVCANNHNL
jgi:hypothetical protein